MTKEVVQQETVVEQATGTNGSIAMNKNSDSTSSQYQTFLQAKVEKEQILKSGYSTTKRMMEIFCVVFYFGVVLSWGLYQAFSLAMDQYRHYQESGTENLYVPFHVDLTLQIIVGILVGMLTADFVSGVLHWGADTWGSIDWPVVGQTFIRSFREHHIAPQAMCKHDFIETNGDNCLVAAVIGIIPLLFYTNNLFMTLCFVFFGLLAAYTNQIHKWSHMYKVPAVVKFLQSTGIILSRGNHNIHHKSPFDTYYCITTGWLNLPLQQIQFWRMMETVVTMLTGLIPRSDDMKWTDHLSLIQDNASKEE